MKKLIFISCLLMTAITTNAQQSEFPKLTGPYLGQKPPGTTPEIFAPDIVSSEEFRESKGAFSPDGTEFYFVRFLPELRPTLFFTAAENGVWTTPAKLQIAQDKNTYCPCVSHDNKWLFLDLRFFHQASQSGIYVSERTATGWSLPTFAGAGMYITSDDSSRYYTTVESPKRVDLAKMTFRSGQFAGYERLEIGPNYGRQAHPCIASDGSYILFDTNGEHLFVSFKKKDGTWGEAMDLTQHGFDVTAGLAYISPDGKYLFYFYDGDIWWVDIKVIEKLRPKE